MDKPGIRAKRAVLLVLALGLGACLLLGPFRRGWNQMGTDFPNYYTAAVLVRQGAPLHNYYDWPWFQRQINYAGIERQLGGYIPQTPATMLPMLPLCGFPPQAAKRLWLICDLAFLCTTIWLLSRVTRFGYVQVALLAFAGWGSLSSNVTLGQYYIFLLLLLTVAFYWIHGGRAFAGGLVMGLAFGLKLYGAPFLLFFALKRQWKAVAGMAAASAALGLLAIFIFGWADAAYYLTHILPRSLLGETIDPYNAGNNTLTTLLRRAFVMEPELNPHPLVNAPWAYFILQESVTLSILIFPLIMLRQSENLKRDFAWFMAAVLLASPNVASYTFTLLLLPVALLLDEMLLGESLFLLTCYILLAAPIPSRWVWLFPKVWLLAAIVALAGRHYWPMLRWKTALVAVTLITCVCGVTAAERMAAYHREPERRFERVALERGALYSSSPAVIRSGLVYESIGGEHYVLRWLHNSHIDRFAFDGEALHPLALSPDGPIQFELVAHRATRLMLLYPSTGQVVPQFAPVDDTPRDPLPSPDGNWLAFTLTRRGTQQIWLRRTDQSGPVELTGGNCNSFSPAWGLDSQAIYFASDCGRGLGLPALYRAAVSSIQVLPVRQTR
jgi:Glycosyltransferase family 87/WD40-like Beta Propeller Repeat